MQRGGGAWEGGKYLALQYKVFISEIKSYVKDDCIIKFQKGIKIDPEWNIIIFIFSQDFCLRTFYKISYNIVFPLIFKLFSIQLRPKNTGMWKRPIEFRNVSFNFVNGQPLYKPLVPLFNFVAFQSNSSQFHIKICPVIGTQGDFRGGGGGRRRRMGRRSRNSNEDPVTAI